MSWLLRRDDESRDGNRTGRRRWRRGPLITLAAAAALAVAGSAAPVFADTADEASPVECVETRTPVTLTEGGAEQYEVYGELCLPEGGTPDTVQLLLPGGTYNHTYWDFPYQPETYSYVRHMVGSGHATFNIDRIGTGQSSHPLGAGLSVYTGAFVTHQLVGKLREGAIAGTAFDRVVLVGHSLGSSVLWSEASTYQDVDGVIVTGMAHPPTGISVDSIPEYRNLTYPAILEPRFANRDATYITTIPGTRGGPLFYHEGNVDPVVPEIDEQTKDTITAAELATFPVFILDGTSSRIRVPTLVVLGGKDVIFCGAIGGIDCTSSGSLFEHESAHYPPEAQLETFVLPDAGHDINLHRNAPDWYRAAEGWVDRHFG